MRALFIGQVSPKYSPIWEVVGEDIIPSIPILGTLFLEGWTVSGDDIVADGSPAVSPWIDSAPDMIASIYVVGP